MSLFREWRLVHRIKIAKRRGDAALAEKLTRELEKMWAREWKAQEQP